MYYSVFSGDIDCNRYAITQKLVLNQQKISNNVIIGRGLTICVLQVGLGAKRGPVQFC